MGFCAQNPSSPYVGALQKQLQGWSDITTSIGMKAMKNPDEVNAAAYDYLMYSGYTVLAWVWAQSAQVASQALENNPSEADTIFYKEKLVTARFYFERILPRTLALKASMESGVDSLPEFSAPL